MRFCISLAVIAFLLIGSSFTFKASIKNVDSPMNKHVIKYIRANERVKAECQHFNAIIFQKKSENSNGSTYYYLVDCATKSIDVSVRVNKEYESIFF